MLRYSLSEARPLGDRSPATRRSRRAISTGALSDVAEQMTTGTALNATVRTIGPRAPARAGQTSTTCCGSVSRPSPTTIKHARATRGRRSAPFRRRRGAFGGDRRRHRVRRRPGGPGRRPFRYPTASWNGSSKIGGTLMVGNQPGGGAVVADPSAPGRPKPTCRPERRVGH